MAVDPERLQYEPWPDDIVRNARARFRAGLLARLHRIGIDAGPLEPMIELEFVGTSAPPEVWTLFRSDEPATWYQSNRPSEDELLDTAESFGEAAATFYDVIRGR